LKSPLFCPGRTGGLKKVKKQGSKTNRAARVVYLPVVHAPGSTSERFLGVVNGFLPSVAKGNREGLCPSFKERGTKGVRLINNLANCRVFTIRGFEERLRSRRPFYNKE